MGKKLYELTNTQKNILSMEQYYNNTSVNNICGDVYFDMPVDFEKLTQALNILINTNDIFKLRITNEQEHVKQYFDDAKVCYNPEVINITNKSELPKIENELGNKPLFAMDSQLFEFKIFKLPNNYGGSIINIHHIIADSWTIGLICKRTIEIYDNLTNNRDDNGIEYSYFDYMKKEKEYLNSDSFIKDKEYWNGIYKTVPELATIPSIKRKKQLLTNCEGNRKIFNIQSDTLQKIKSFCSNNRISVYNFFMSIFSIYIGRVSNLDDFVIGTPILNRLNNTDKHTMGMFVSTVPLRINIDESNSFINFSKSIAQESISMLRHQRYPYQMLLADLRKIDSNVPNLYDIVFSYQITKTINDNSKYSSHWAFNGTSANDIQIQIIDQDSKGSLDIIYDFQSKKYLTTDIVNIHKRVCNMINQILNNTDIKVNEIETVIEDEKKQIFYKFNGTKVDYPKSKTIIDLYEEQVKKSPYNIAVLSENEKLTYKELNEKANSLARYLSNNGVKEGDIVAICLKRNTSLIISILAILKLGCAYMPICPEYPVDRINYIMNDSKTRFIITDNVINDLNNDTKMFDLKYIDLSKLSTENLNINYSQNYLAYIIYTSGTTGNPKGIMITHKNLINFVYSFNNCFKNKFSTKDICMSSTNISFDVSMYELFTPLIFGSCLALYPNNNLTDIPLFVKLLNEWKVTSLYIPPNILLDIYNFIKKNNIDTSISKLLVGVEPIKNSTLNKYYNINPKIEIVNGYGPSEATICSTFYIHKCNDDRSNKIVPIGKPIANNKILILNRSKNIQPVFIPGEICISGDNVSLGYLNNIKLSNDAFKILKYSDTPFYLTGDIGYWDNDGIIHFVGRKDSQVKIRGHRIELNEINSNINNMEGVHNSATILKKINNYPVICSYIVAKDKKLKTEDIYKHLKKILPYYMIPSYFTFIDELPLNINGKIDKTKLPDISILPHKTEMAVSITNTEKTILKILEKTLNVKIETIDDTFSSLGLDSLMTIRLSMNIFDELNINIKIEDIYFYNSIRKLSSFIDSQNTKVISKDVINDIPLAEPQEFYPLSSAQKRIYYASKMAGEDNLVYNTPGAILINQILDNKKVESIFNEIISKQSSFRTTFVLENGEVKQKVLDNISIKVLAYKNSEGEIDGIISNFTKPFNLEKAPLLRVELHYIDNKMTLLLYDSHHIIIDGVSINILLKEFFELYDDKNLKKLPVQYKDYAIWENNNIKNNKLQQNKNYWIDRFKDYNFESLNLPYDYTIPVNRSYIGKKIYTTFDANKFTEVNDCAKRYNISPYIVFLTTLFITLYKYTGQSDLVIGSPVANRTVAETQDIIGMFVNNMAIRNKILFKQSVIDLLSYVNKKVREDLENQSYPYDLLIKDLGIPTDNSKNPLFDIVFTYQNEYNDLQLKKSDIIKALDIQNNTAKFNITLEVNPKSNQINVEYRTDLFKPDTINSFIQHYEHILEQVIENVNATVDDINIITEDEQELLNKFNNTTEPICRDTVSKIFERQAYANPNDIAVICDDKTLTYKELNENANCLANYLIDNGTKPNDIIAIMANRSLETVVCMIAVLKAGAAFLNIDPTYPIERTEYYIEDSKIEHVLIQKELTKRAAKIKNRIEIDLNNKDIYNGNKENPIVKNKEHDLSYIIYTSGSTGQPKGVMLNQIGLSNMVQAMTKVLDYLKEGNKHTIVSVTSTPFDIFVYEIIVSLTHGLKVVMANNAEHRNPKLLDKLIRKYNVDVMTVTPSLMKINYDNREPNSALANVKNMVFGGEPLPEKFVQDLKKLADDITIYNIYGPSEITVLSNVQNLNGEKEITVGHPILNTQIHILDKDMKKVPIGVIGEIYISGIQVGEGYMGKEKLTESKFLKNPFGSGKIYKTGDIGRWTFDGKVQCLGRIDNQVKLRGLRIELGEIENIISNIDGVSSAIVNKIEIYDKEVLCAYYVADSSITENNVKNTLRKYLPQYMVPTYIMRLDEMPYTINRKIDRKALPIPQMDRSINTKKINIEELDSNEEKLIQIWKNILKIDDISIDDNFFDIGGDSISAINMQIEALKYGLQFEYADIFNFPTIKQLSKKMPNPEEKFMIDYDYNQINEILSRNNIDNIEQIQRYEVGNALLIGGTGYLGVHILNEFIKNEKGIIYCLIRQKNNENPKTRLTKTLNFYFGDNYAQNNSARIKVVKGDIIKDNLGLSDEDYDNIIKNVNVVINAGALVKHFGLKKKFEEINVLGTQNIIKLCKEHKKRLVHASTISVSGFGEKEEFSKEEEGIKEFTEQNLYIGQNLKGIYGITKYKAELNILEAISDGLDAQILRIGNITNRYADGVFQQNINENAFVRRIKSFVEIGAFPKYMLDHKVELTPVDLCANAIIKIVQHNSKCNVFHLYNPNLLPISLFYKTVTNRGISLVPVSEQMMCDIISGILDDDKRKNIVSGIIQDLNSDKTFTYTSRIKLENKFTDKYLEKIGFGWPIYDKDYINKCFAYFKKIDFINNELEENIC